MRRPSSRSLHLLPLFLLLLLLLLPFHHAFLHPPQLQLPPQPSPSHPRPHSLPPSTHRRTTHLHSDIFFNFEGLKRKLNLTHFQDPALENAPPFPEEDFYNRPDLVKARAIAQNLAPQFTAPTQYTSVSLYFHVWPHHLQSFRESLHDFVVASRSRRRESESEGEGEEDEEVFWEAFQMVGLPEELDETRYPGKQAGRVPSRSRLLLCGSFANAEAEERAKKEVVAWRTALKERLASYNLPVVSDDEGETQDLVETMPMSQAVYRRVRPMGPPLRPSPPSSSSSSSSSPLYLLSFLQASWSSARKIQRHLDRVHQYMDDITNKDTNTHTHTHSPLATRAELYINPDYPSAHKLWQEFENKEALVECMSGPYVGLLEEGAKFRARVNHVEQVFAPLVLPSVATGDVQEQGYESEDGGGGCWPVLSAVLKQRKEEIDKGAAPVSRMPLVGYGTGVYKGREREGTLSISEGVRTAIRAGCRLLDCSPDYGTQLEVGHVLKEVFAAGETRRDRLFLVSSLSRGCLSVGGDRDGHVPEVEKIKRDIEKTLQELGTDYLDALLVPVVPSMDVKATWRAVEEAIASLTTTSTTTTTTTNDPIIRHLGVTGANPLPFLQTLQQLQQEQQEASTSTPTPTHYPPSICQTEHHPFHLPPPSLLTHCHSHHIHLLAHTPLGRPALSRPPGTNILEEPLIEMSADALECTPAQLTLRWAVQQGVSVVPNSLSVAHIVENVDVGSFRMAGFRVEVLKEMAGVRGLRFVSEEEREERGIEGGAAGEKGEEGGEKGAKGGGGRKREAPLFTLEEVKAKKIVYEEDGTVIPPGTPFEYLQLSVEVFERLDLGDAAELLLEPKEIDGVFPGMDVEPVEEEGEEGEGGD